MNMKKIYCKPNTKTKKNKKKRGKSLDFVLKTPENNVFTLKLRPS